MVSSLNYCVLKKNKTKKMSKEDSYCFFVFFRVGATLGIRKLEQELTNKHLDSQSGRSGDFQYTASK